MSTASEVAEFSLRGTIAAMAMTGMRSVTVAAGLVKESPPRAIIRQKSHGLSRLVPRRKRRVVIELAHWSVGAAGGAGFALLPDRVRTRRFAGPLYGLAVWLGFELGIAPALGLSQAKRLRPVERLALAADHLLYGIVLSEPRRRPRE